MPWFQPLVSGTLRVAAVVLGGAAVSVLVQTRTPAQPDVASAAPAPPASVDAHRASSDVATQPWTVTADGWHIRVGNADIDFPTIAEAFADRPRTVPVVRLSPYDEVVKFYARKAGLDWRLITAVMEAESGFDPSSRSHMGAYGLMQVRPIAARAVGEKAFRQPADNIRTGVRYLRKLQERYHAADRRDRLMLMLAAYNAGPGHLRDAQQLAREHGLDPHRWLGGLREVLPALENPRVYPHLRHGYARGTDVIRYVEGVWSRFLHYQRLTAAEIVPPPAPQRPAAADSAAIASDHAIRG